MKKKIRICPKCGSEDIEIKPKVLDVFGGFPFTIKCNKCGVKSSMVIEKEIKSTNKKLMK